MIERRRPQVPELEQVMEKCVYAESIVADLLNGTGEIQVEVSVGPVSV